MKPLLFILAVSFLALTTRAQDPLPSWNDTAPKKAIQTFVEKVTKDGSQDFVQPADRIAVFDNDGTLWCEQPAYFQLLYIFDRIKSLAPQHPEWKEKEPFSSLLKRDLKAVAAGGEKALLELFFVTHTGMTDDEFSRSVSEWLNTARHPRFHQLYTELVYQPMLELLAYLRANGFKTFIVSGGTADFIRVFAEKSYGIPPEQVLGSSIKRKFEIRDGKPVIVRLPAIGFIDDKEGKPVGIADFIGRKPIMAFGNSDGDLQMLQYTTGAGGPGFGLIVHHTDAEREYAYDRKSHIGKLDKALEAAAGNGWTVVDMKDDWKTVFPSK